MDLAMVGINFRTAPMELREKLSVQPDEVAGALRALAEKLPDTELVLLSTCNRTELYAAAPGIQDRVCALIRLLLEMRMPSGGGDARERFYSRTNVEAVQHLMAVAASIDSMVVGETEILGQVKEAYRLAAEAQMTGRALNPLFHRAFRAAKRVHTETDICRGRVSVSSIAVEFAEKVFEDLSSKTVIVVGAGETGELTLKSLIEKGVKDVLILNRSLDKGRALAERCGGRAIQFDLLEDYLPRADIVISSTAAPHCIIQADLVRRCVAGRHGRPMFLIDIAVPRDIEESVNAIENVYLYNIDDLQRIAEENLAIRQESLQAASRIVRQESLEFASSFQALGLGDLMRQMEEAVSRIKDAELERSLSREALAALPEASKEEIRLALHRVASKILAAPRKALNEAAKNGRWEDYARIVSHLFDLDEKDRRGNE